MHDEAIAAHDEAIAAQQRAIARSSQLTTESFIIDSYEPLTARRLAAAAWRVSATPQAMAAMAGLLTEQQQEGMLPGDQADGGVRTAVFSPSGQLLASANANGTVRLWDPATGRAGHLLKVETGSPTGLPQEEVSLDVRAAVFSPDGELVATADPDGTVRLWSVSTGRPYGAVLRAGTGPGGVTGVAFSPDGQRLASADANGTVRLWEMTGRAVGTQLLALASPRGVNGIAFSPDGQRLATANMDGTVRLWDPQTGQPEGAPLIVDFGHSVTGVAFSRDGSLLAAGDGDGYVRTWQIAPLADPYAALCADVGAPTQADWARYFRGEQHPRVC